MIEVYVKGNEDYGSNGDMTLTPTTCEVELTVEGVAELTLEHPIDDLGRWEYLVTDNVIAAPTPYSKKQLFRIYDYTKTETEVTAYARHIFYDSAGEMLVDVRPTDKTGQEALDIILSGTKYKAKSNIKTRSTAYYIRKNIMEAIGGDDENSFINRWGGERMYDNFTVIINDRLGGDYGACAEFGRNMTGIEADISIDDVVTRIIPESYNGYTLEGEEPWVDSPLIGNYANPRAAVIKFEDVKLLEDCQEGEEGFSTLELLREELKRRCEKEYENGLDKPKVNYKVDLVEIADTDDYKDYKKLTTIGIGDDVLTRDRKLKINVTARCIRLVYDCIEEENTEVELGNYTENYFDKTTSAADIIQKVTREDGTLKAEEVYGKIDAVKAQLKAQRDISQPSEVRAVLFEDLVEGSPTYGAMSIGTMGFCIASERTADGKDWDWKTFGTGRGFYADYVCVGQLDGALIRADSIQAESISINYRKSVESHISEAVDTVERNYKNTIDELKSDFKKTYTTFQYVDETAGSLASEAETNAKGYTEEQLKKYVTIVEMGTKIDQTAEEIKTEASKTYTTYKYVDDSTSKAESNANNYADTVGAGAKSYTDEQLKKYVTTTEMTTAISQTAEQIKTEAKKTYTSFEYVDETAGNLADEAEANAKSYADETAAAAADQALADAKADTDGKLKNYVTQVNMKTSIDQSAESVKTYAKKAVDALKHNYIENGTFESGNLDGWKLSDSENIIATNDEYLGNVASITRGTSNIYMYQSWKLKAGTYTVRFKAGADLRSISKARIRVSLGGISYYTKAGELDDEVFKQYETEITISSAGTKYLYVYNYVDNTTIYIKDVEVLGKYEDHAEAQFTVANDAIEAEVKRAEGIEDELRSSIQVNANKITSKVEKGDMGSYITQYYNNVLVAFNNSSKYVQISAGQIAIYNGEVTTKGKRAVFDQSGNAFYRDNYFVGRIGTNEWKSNSAHKGLTFDLEYQGKYMAWAQEESSSATSYDTILCYSRANSIYTEKGLHFGCNVYAHGWNLHNADLRNTSYDGYSSWTGEIPIITKIQANSDGTITWWSSSITVRNGGITSAPRS
ncbi:phage tail spike protein [Coprococcus sp. AF51-11b1]|uniref:phage tail spike protein n=1 Tax=Coprococcus sp. AF51-11b1 TaxID=2997947 RepID=UPI0022DF810E|nr:phage tail spike protein [Coprococcus sp. AF51-11b1]